MFIPNVSLNSKESQWVEPKKIQLCIVSKPCPPEQIVKQLALIDGPIDVYSWYEGPQALPQSGAFFMKERIFDPLYQIKKDAKLYLYSLNGWDFRNVKRNITTMPSSTRLGEAINRINLAYVECIYSSSFFQYCAKISQESSLYSFIREELPSKEWLYKLSDTQRKKGISVSAFFNNQPSLFDCIKDLDVASAYSPMQYIEGYYLIQESVRKGLLKEQKKIGIAFVLPNDESKYYADLPKDIEKMVRLDFGNDLDNVEVNISFYFFLYGDSIAARPYINRQSKAPIVKENEIPSYFNYLTQEGY